MADKLIHPGEHLAEELKGLGMSTAKLARNLDVPTNRITAILHGRRSIIGDTALRLGHFFGTAPEFWLSLQSVYELRRPQGRSGKSVRRLPRLKHPERVGLSELLGSRFLTTPFEFVIPSGATAEMRDLLCGAFRFACTKDSIVSCLPP